MNKKIYSAPTIHIVSILHQTHIMNGSPGIATSEGPASRNGEVLSRRGDSFWDDED